MLWVRAVVIEIRRLSKMCAVAFPTMPPVGRRDFVQCHRGLAVSISALPWYMRSAADKKKRRHTAIYSKAPGQPPFRPAAVFNLLAITCWATFVLCPLATWVLDLP